MTVPVFFIIDIIWLGVIARDFYRSQMDVSVNWTAATIFYLMYIVGILIFAVIPALKSGDWTTALIWGALFGFFTYATYDLTNLATLANWPLKLAVVDIIWGTVLGSSVATVSYYLGKTFLF
jgi:uncharacterized membrane protein